MLSYKKDTFNGRHFYEIFSWIFSIADKLKSQKMKKYISMFYLLFFFDVQSNCKRTKIFHTENKESIETNHIHVASHLLRFLDGNSLRIHPATIVS